MAKRKISADNLKKIRKSYKEDRINSSPDHIPSRNQEIKNAKRAGKELKINETGHTPKELRKIARQNLKNIKKDFSSTQKSQAIFSFEPGDTVSFNYRGSEEMGLIVSMWVPNECSTREQAKNSGVVTLLSSVGRIEIKPIEIIEKL
jgi:vacuolar-type H+-ATPase subunit I/STV1